MLHHKTLPRLPTEKDTPAAENGSEVLLRAQGVRPGRPPGLLKHLYGCAVVEHQPRMHDEEAEQAQAEGRIDHERDEHDCRPATSQAGQIIDDVDEDLQNA